MATTLSLVRPYPRARLPQALLPIIPPIVQRGWLEGSGPKRIPAGERLSAAPRAPCRARPGPCGRWVHLQHPVQVAAEVDHDAAPDRVAGDRRATPA